jgi:HSP20 family protein
MASTQVEVKKAQPMQKPAADAWSSLRTEMDRLFDRFSSGWNLPAFGAPFGRLFGTEPALRYESSFSFTTPAVDVAENGTQFKITAELPGLTEADIEVKVSDDMLTLKGEKRQEREEKDENYHLSERSYGSFERSFRLPPSVERDKIQADFAKGVLTVTLPKSAAAQQQEKTIPIKAAA